MTSETKLYLLSGFVYFVQEGHQVYFLSEDGMMQESGCNYTFFEEKGSPALPMDGEGLYNAIMSTYGHLEED